jgi:hypothetical protein
MIIAGDLSAYRVRAVGRVTLVESGEIIFE